MKPESKALSEDEAKILRREYVLAALEFGGRCPEADTLLAALDRSDAKLLAAVRARQVPRDRAAVEPLVPDDLKALPPADRYGYATEVLPAFWAKE